MAAEKAVAAPLREAATDHQNVPAREPGAPMVGHPRPVPAPARSASPDVFGFARAYMARGWACFMLSADKIPVRLCGSLECEQHRKDGAAAMESCDCLTCHGFYAATTDPVRFLAILRRVPAGQLAIRTGECSGLVIVEVDPKNDGTATLADLDRRGVLPGTIMVESGGGGIHFYYAHPGGYVPGGAHKLGRGVDVKADGGYVVAPPALHRSGRRYAWVGSGRFDYPITDLHPDVLKILRPERSTQTRSAPPVQYLRSGDIRRRAQAVLEKVVAAEDGNGNATLFWAACVFGEMVSAGHLPREWAEAALERAAEEMSYPLPAARRTIRSGLQRRPR